MVDIKPPSVSSSKLPQIENGSPTAVRNDNPISIAGAVQAPKVSNVEQSIVKMVDVRGLGQVPQHLSKVALGIVEKSYKDALDAEIFEAIVQRDKWVEKNINDPITGIRQYRNRNAAGLPDKIGSSYQAFSDTIKEGLSEHNRSRWNVLSESARVRVGMTTMNHTAKELDNYMVTNEKALIESSKERVRGDLSDFGSAMTTGITVLEQSLTRKGIPVDSPAALLEKTKFTDDIVTRAISGHVGTNPSSKDILESTTLLNKYAGAMSFKAVDRLQVGLDKAFRATTVNEAVSSVVDDIAPQDRYESLSIEGVSEKVAAYINDPILQLEAINKIDAFAKQRDIEIRSAISAAEDDYLNQIKSGAPEETAKSALADLPLDEQYNIANRQRQREVSDMQLRSALSAKMGSSRSDIAKSNISILLNNSTPLDLVLGQINGAEGISDAEKVGLIDYTNASYLKRGETDLKIDNIKAKDDISISIFNTVLANPHMLFSDPEKPGSYGFESLKSDLSTTHRAALIHIASGLDQDGNIQAGVDSLKELFSKTIEGDDILNEGRNVGGIPAELTSEYSKMLNDFLASSMGGDSADSLVKLREKIDFIRGEQVAGGINLTGLLTLGTGGPLALLATGQSVLKPTQNLSPEFLASSDIQILLGAIGGDINEADVLQGYADKLGFSGRIINMDSGQKVMMFDNRTMAYINSDGNIEIRRNRGTVRP